MRFERAGNESQLSSVNKRAPWLPVSGRLFEIFLQLIGDVTGTILSVVATLAASQKPGA
jgi:hypothetical protein